MSNYQNYDRLLQVAKQVGFKHCNTIIWIKGNKTSSNCSYMGAYEMIMQLRKGKSIPINKLGESNVICDVPNKIGKREHPTQKPINLFSRFILQSSKESEIVLDCFMGSGSTGMACLKTGRKFIGCEIDEKYYGVAVERLEEI